MKPVRGTSIVTFTFVNKQHNDDNTLKNKTHRNRFIEISNILKRSWAATKRFSSVSNCGKKPFRFGSTILDEVGGSYERKTKNAPKQK